MEEKINNINPPDIKRTPLSIVKQISLMINDKCNLRCSYCYQNHNRSGNEMSEELTDKLIKELNGGLLDYNTIMFLGGETLLSQDIIIKFILSLKRQYRYMIMTNGTIPLKSFCSKVKDYKDLIGFGFSYDGLNQTNRTIRDIEKILDNIKWLQENDFGFTIIHTLSGNSVFNLIDNILYLSKIHKNIKVKRICNLHQSWNKEAKEYFIDNLSKTTLLTAYLNTAKDYYIQLPNHIQLPKDQEGIIRHGYCCQNSIASDMDVVYWDGGLYPCENRAANHIGKYGEAFKDLKNRPYKFTNYNDEIIYNICSMYNTVEPKVDEALEEQRIKYKEFQDKIRRLKWAKIKN